MNAEVALTITLNRSRKERRGRWRMMETSNAVG